MNNDQKPAARYAKTKFIRAVLLSFGLLFAFLAFLGVWLPLLPTTPFLILAAACFSRSSERLYHWIMYNRMFGHYLRDYKSGKGIPVRVKIIALAFLWSTISFSAFVLVHPVWVKTMLMVIATAVTIHIVMVRPRKGHAADGSDANRNEKGNPV